MNYAHQRGVIHRDLKPRNILVGSDGQPKILDFGLAKQTTNPEETLVSMTGQVMGTPAYMSPEQVRGDAANIDIRTDVYTLGVVLYGLLTGKPPYPVDGSLGTVFRHISDTPPAPPSRQWEMDTGVRHRSKGRAKTVNCPIDEEVQTILLKALTKEPERRYQSAGELARDIENYLTGMPIEAKRDSGLYLARKLLHRYRVPAALATGSLVVIVVGFILITGLYMRNRTLLREAEDSEPVAGLFGGLTPVENARIPDHSRNLDRLLTFLTENVGNSQLDDVILRIRQEGPQLLDKLEAVLDTNRLELVVQATLQERLARVLSQLPQEKQPDCREAAPAPFRERTFRVFPY